MDKIAQVTENLVDLQNVSLKKVHHSKQAKKINEFIKFTAHML